MTLSTLFFSTLLMYVIGSQARTLLRHCGSNIVTNDISLDSFDVNFHGQYKQTQKKVYDHNVRVDESDHPSEKTQEELDRLHAIVDLSLVDIDEFPFARCMDGSAGGFYWKHASTPEAKDNWIIHLQGGGECDTAVRCNYLK